MNSVKNSYQFQSDIKTSKKLKLFPIELVRTMIQEDKKYSVDDARTILNTQFKVEFKDIINEIRNE